MAAPERFAEMPDFSLAPRAVATNRGTATFWSLLEAQRTLVGTGSVANDPKRLSLAGVGAI
jgi:hypothetical protein